MGWNALRIRRPAPILAGLGDAPSVYFVHSYHAVADRPEDVAAESDHPDPFTAVVWRDFVRDQANLQGKTDPAKGRNSVATKGQPADEDSVVVIVVAPGTRVETRFRSPTDETSKGVTAPEKVKSDESTSSNVKPAGKAVQFRAEDLLPGLFVEAEFRGSGQRDKNQATTVTVIRPIKVLDSSPAAESAPKR